MTDYSSAEYSDDYYADYPVPAASYVESFIPDESEEENLFFSEWNEQVPASKNDADAVSLCVWPNVDRIVNLKRLDVYQCHEPKAHQASSNPTESLKIRRSQNWFALRSIFFMDQALAFTKELHVETGGGPIRRQRYRPVDKSNRRDTSSWILKEILHAYNNPSNIPGASEFHVDHVDSPDRYFISSSPNPTPACRRLFRFSAYSATQYYILGREITHECLQTEGGVGTTYIIESGPFVRPKKNWRLIGSFFGFDEPLTCTNAYTVYMRMDPFPRMVIALDTFDRIEEWTPTFRFHAFDIPVPGITQHHQYIPLKQDIPAIDCVAAHAFQRSPGISECYYTYFLREWKNVL